MIREGDMTCLDSLNICKDAYVEAYEIAYNSLVAGYENFEKFEKIILKAIYKFGCLNYSTLHNYMCVLFGNEHMNLRFDGDVRYFRKCGYIEVLEEDGCFFYFLSDAARNFMSEFVYKGTSAQKANEVFTDVSDKSRMDRARISAFYNAAIRYNKELYISGKGAMGEFLDDDGKAIPACKIQLRVDENGHRPVNIFAFSCEDNEEEFKRILRLLYERARFRTGGRPYVLLNICNRSMSAYNGYNIVCSMQENIPLYFSALKDTVRNPLRTLYKLTNQSLMVCFDEIDLREVIMTKRKLEKEQRLGI